MPLNLDEKVMFMTAMPTLQRLVMPGLMASTGVVHSFEVGDLLRYVYGSEVLCVLW
jgi:hypothetical protein